MTNRKKHGMNPRSVALARLRLIPIERIGPFLGKILSRLPVRMGLKLADLLGWLAWFVLRVPTRRQVNELFGAGQVGSHVPRAMLGCFFRQKLLDSLLKRGKTAAYGELVECDGLERLRRLKEEKRPAILVGCHVGISYVLLVALSQAGIPILVLRQNDAIQSLPGVTTIALSNSRKRAVAFLRTAIKHLNEGGLLGVMVDGSQGESTEERLFLGRRFPAQKGLDFLCDKTDAVVVPFSNRWVKGEKPIEVRIHEPLEKSPRGSFVESSLVWFDRDIRSRPQELRLSRVFQLLSCPTVEQTLGDADS